MGRLLRRWNVVLILLLAVASGCARRQELNEVYGRRTGYGARSINGTSALGDLFKQAGHRVRSWRYLSPSLEDADVVVWFPSEHQLVPGGGFNYQPDVNAPSPEAVDWLDEWLRYSGVEKTLIYVGRDWEAAPEYWASTKAAAPLAQTAEFARRLSEARTAERSRLALKPNPDECDWLAIGRGAAKTEVKKLVGPLAKGVDADKAALEHWSSLDVRQEAETLLADGQGHPLVSEHVIEVNGAWSGVESRLIVVENGGFLLNGALVNHERRKLASRLVDHLGPPRKRVVFLETGPSPTIRETDPNPRPPTGLELFGIWPVGAVLAQVAALGIVYASSRWPVFGAPRRLRPPSLTDFGRHVHALARLLAATRDRSYAVSQLKTYFHVGAPRTPAAKTSVGAVSDGDLPNERASDEKPTLTPITNR